MTDNEIIKALECCVRNEYVQECKKCPLKTRPQCEEVLFKGVIDLINRQKEEIDDGKKVIAELRELFIKRMTVDSDHNDRRRKDFNQAIFDWWDDEPNKVPENTFPCWAPMTMDLVLRCFDDAVKDWRRTWCDVENCTRKE